MFLFNNSWKEQESQRFSGIFRVHKLGTLSRNRLNAQRKNCENLIRGLKKCLLKEVHLITELYRLNFGDSYKGAHKKIDPYKNLFFFSEFLGPTYSPSTLREKEFRNLNQVL